MRKNLLILLFLVIVPISAYAATSYEIEAAVNDETFIINGEVFKAKTYCMGWDKGERVIFLEGSASGACATATLYNINRKEQCEVWCE
jgi:hypothetical protein